MREAIVITAARRTPTGAFRGSLGGASATELKVCGADAIRAGSVRINAPYLLSKARQGYRMGHGQILDHMFYDGLQNPYDGALMGHFADMTARKYGFTRAQQDDFAAESVRRALAACTGGAFGAEITAVSIKGRKGEQLIEQDEPPFNCDIARIPTLKPAFCWRASTSTAATRPPRSPSKWLSGYF